jgi:hypothetical protein
MTKAMWGCPGTGEKAIMNATETDAPRWYG